MPFLPTQLPNRAGKFDVFYASGASHIYEVPDGASALFMAIVGGGGGGGAGFSAAAAAARGGGGGGGTGAVTRLIVSTLILPRLLYVNPGLGGTSAGNGGASFIGATPTTGNTTNIGFANGGNAGGTGTGAAVGAGGTAGGAASILNVIFSWLAPHEYGAGQAGAAGGAVAGAAGAATTWGNLGICAGAGGGGTTSADFAGGNITGTGLVPTVLGGAAGSNVGNAGYWMPDLLIGTGGSGGGSSNTGNGGRGGDGAPGCGGGGGGGGVTGGAGGRGGHGFVVIQAI